MNRLWKEQLETLINHFNKNMEPTLEKLALLLHLLQLPIPLPHIKEVENLVTLFPLKVALKPW